MAHKQTYNPQSPSASFKTAFDSKASDIAAVPVEKLIPINLDVTGVVITALGVASEVLALRQQIVEELPKFDIGHVDDLEALTLALGYSHSLALASTEVEPVDGLMHELSDVRDVLVSDATALAKRSLVDGERLKELRGGTAYRNVISDVMMLVALFRKNAEGIVGKTAVTTDEIDHAEKLAQDLAKALGHREQAQAGATEAAQTRRQAFALFMNAYEQVRRAVGYVRAQQGDADEIIPSLYAGRGGHRKADVTPVTPDAPPAPAPEVAPVIPIGLPGGSPFTTT